MSRTKNYMTWNKNNKRNLRVIKYLKYQWLPQALTFYSSERHPKLHIYFFSQASLPPSPTYSLFGDLSAHLLRP